jgi:hypothetical protein
MSVSRWFLADSAGAARFSARFVLEFGVRSGHQRCHHSCLVDLTRMFTKLYLEAGKKKQQTLHRGS